jgi:dextranase
MTIVLSKSTYKPGEKIAGSSSHSGELIVSRLSTKVLSLKVDKDFEIEPLPQGAYAVELIGDNGELSYSAIEVLSEPWQRIRYGFLSEFSSNVDIDAQVEWAKRLHLTSIQFYDWAYKHEFLMAPTDSYADPLGGEISKAKLKELIAGYEAAGIYPSGYAAVYAVDREGWARWNQSGVYGDDGKPFQLGEDFLWVIDPADAKWLPHLIGQLKEAREFGFKTFHLDQYGWPKIAVKPNGDVVDIAESFTKMLNAITAQVEDANFIFNNVNDFPTWATATTEQDALYIEVWDPNSDYKDLAHLVDKARSYDPLKPVILSAYLKPFAEKDIVGAEAALELSLAVISSRGASHLITGGDGRVLHDPYYVRHHVAGESTRNILENYHNFICASGDLLFDRDRVDITRTHAFGVNTEINIESDASIGPNFDAGTLATSIFESPTGYTMQIINLLDQKSAAWDEAKLPIKSSAKVKISLLGAGFESNWHIGRAERASKFESIAAKQSGAKLEVEIEITGAWTLIHVPKK